MKAFKAFQFVFLNIFIYFRKRFACCFHVDIYFGQMTRMLTITIPVPSDGLPKRDSLSDKRIVRKENFFQQFKKRLVPRIGVVITLLDEWVQCRISFSQIKVYVRLIFWYILTVYFGVVDSLNLRFRLVGNKAKGRISKRVFQENKARQIFRKTDMSYSMIHTRTCPYRGVRNIRFFEKCGVLCFLETLVLRFTLLS